MERRLAVVVLAWNAREDVLRCLASLRGELGAGDVAIVVDNASSDGTAAAVRAAHPAVELLGNAENLGYAGGMNAGVRRALELGAPWVLLLNQDTEVPPGTLATLFAAAARHGDAAALQPLLVRADGATIDSAGQRLHRVPGATDRLAGRPLAEAPAADEEVFGPCGAAALVRAEVFRETGLFDEEFFLIFEDVDLAFRMRLAGRRTVLVPAARVVHRRGISGAGASQSPLRRFLVARNSVALALRYWPAGWVVASAPGLTMRVLRALLLRRAAGRTCLPLWRRAWDGRSAARAAACGAGLDVWFAADRAATTSEDSRTARR